MLIFLMKKICKYCPETGLQDISQFGEYQIKGRSKKCRRNKCHTCRRKDEAKRYEENPGVKQRMKLAAKVSSYKREYGISIDDFNQMLIKQNKHCKICNQEMIKPNIDHCHNSGKVRGLLCWNCNIALGYFKDNIENLKSAIKYLGG